MDNSQSKKKYEAPTILLKDASNNELFCYLEQIIPLENKEYALLTPVDTPVTLFRINERNEPELIEKIDKNKFIAKLEDDEVLVGVIVRNTDKDKETYSVYQIRDGVWDDKVMSTAYWYDYKRHLEKIWRNL